MLWHKPASACEEISVAHHGVAEGVKEEIEHFVGTLKPGGSSIRERFTVCRSLDTREGYCVAATWFREGIVSVTTCSTGRGADSAASQLRALKHINPLLLQCFEQWLAVQKLSTRVANLESAVERSDIATAIVARDGELIYANRTCHDLLAQGEGLFLSGERLTCSSLSETLNLQAALAHLLRDSDDDRVDPILSVARENRRALIVAMAPAEHPAAIAGGDGAVLMYLFDPEKCLGEIVEPVCELYGLSGSESKLACALVDGMSISEAAKRLRIQQQTARTYLRQVFSKTDTNRQAELVKLLLSSAIRMVSNRRMRILSQIGNRPLK